MKPYRLIVTDNPELTLGEAIDAGQVTYYATLHDAAYAFAMHAAPYRTIVVEDGHGARELNEREDDTLAAICEEQGVDILGTIDTD